MNEQELNEIRKRTAKAVAPPWTIAPEEDGVDYLECPMCEGEGEVPYGYHINGDGWDGIVQCYGFADISKPNADFVTHARTDIPKLLNEVDRLRKTGQILANEIVRLQISKSGIGHLVEDVFTDAYERAGEALANKEKESE